MQTVIVSENLRPRVHARIMRDVMQKTGERHIRERVGKRFQRNRETAPGGPYGFRARSQRTKKIKRRKGVDPSRPNFRTGEMLAAVKSTSRLTRTQHKWTWRARSNFPLADWRRREMEAISRREIESDTKFMEKLYVREAAKPKNRRKRRSKRG